MTMVLRARVMDRGNGARLATRAAAAATQSRALVLLRGAMLAAGRCTALRALQR